VSVEPEAALAPNTLTDDAKPLPERHSVVRSPRAVLTSRPLLTAALLGLAIFAAERLPVPRSLKPLTASAAAAPAAEEPVPAPVLELGEARLDSETALRPELQASPGGATPPVANGPIAAQHGDLPELDLNREASPVPLVDPSGHALDGFFTALQRTARKESDAITRIAHFGDSVVVSDFVSGTLRRKLQSRFGDAGHGFILMASPWPAYQHNDIDRWASAGWLVSRIVGPLTADNLYGLGGVSFRGPPGVRARFATMSEGDFGRNVARFDLDYLAESRGCALDVLVDGVVQGTVDGQSEQPEARHYEVVVPDGPHRFEVITKRGQCRAFGAVLERKSPGVVLDALGVLGARLRFLDQQEDAHWAQQLRWRNHNLVIYQFGANESADGYAYPMPEYHKTMRAVLEQAKKALPESSCLVLGAMDRVRKEGTEIKTLSILGPLVAEQRAVAEECGCAFFDTRAAMGGPGSMLQWMYRGYGAGDLTHPTNVGAEVLGNWVYLALMSSFAQWQAAHP